MGRVGFSTPAQRNGCSGGGEGSARFQSLCVKIIQGRRPTALPFGPVQPLQLVERGRDTPGVLLTCSSCIKTLRCSYD